MKSTGMIRRIDELGRVVIPKEIRKSLNLKEGAEVEIFTSEEKLILQKHSQLQGLVDIAKESAVILRNIIGLDTFVVDVEKVIVAESVYREKAGEKISPKLFKLLDTRKSRIVTDSDIEITLNDSERYNAILVSPIVVGGDLVGGVVCFSSNATPVDSDLKSVEIISTYISRRLEF